jgi:glutamine synthetase
MERTAFMPAMPQVNNGIPASLRSAPPGMVMSSPMMPQMDQSVEVPYDPLQQPEQPQQTNGGSSYHTLGWLSFLALATGGMFMAGKKGSMQGSALTGGLSNQSQSRSELVTMSAEPVSAEPGSAESLLKGSLLKGFGDDLFKGAVADKYLLRHGLKAGTIEKGDWVKSPEAADKVAAAVLDWATERGATNFCHWFQPMGASGVRHGLSAQVQNAFWEFDKTGKPVWDLKGKDILTGETDGSSYPNGGLRATHRAGGYLTTDPSSPIFLRGDAIFIPACFVSYNGHALDEKTPLVRSGEAMSREGTRLLKLLGYEVDGLQSNIGLEQEFFLLPRDQYAQRLDLQLAGRTVLGRDMPRGQEMCDHYMAPLSFATASKECMTEIQETCYKMGIPLRTRHREVAPGQYEFAPLFGSVTTQIDQNVVVMQVCEEIATEYGLACLFQEKPFSGINGSGKHNNWSIGTLDGTNLLNVGQLAEKSGSSDIFPVVMAAMVRSVDMHGDLMRLAIASPGNDFRLGACEAPPAIMSTYLGEDMTEYLDGYRQGLDKPYKPTTKSLDLGISSIPPLQVPSEDRNRTSPFPFGGHRFEFRAVGSSQNVSLVNTVLNTMTADSFKAFADAIESGTSPKEVAQAALTEHWKSIFNGDNYDLDNQKMLTEKGLWRIDSGVDAIKNYTSEKNIALFKKHGVLSEEECEARRTILWDHYVGTVELEVKCMVDMLNQKIIPAVKQAGMKTTDLEKSVKILDTDLAAIHAEADEYKKADMARTLRLETMVKQREFCDALEGVMPANLWPVPTYSEMLFLDQTTE